MDTRAVMQAQMLGLIEILYPIRVITVYHNPLTDKDTIYDYSTGMTYEAMR